MLCVRVSTVKFNCLFDQLLWALRLILILGDTGVVSRVGKNKKLSSRLFSRPD